MKRLSLVVGLLSLALAAAAAAQAKEKPASSITVTVSGLGCSSPAGSSAFTAQSWSWGARNTATTGGGGGGGAGQAEIGDLMVAKLFDGCSPTLFGAVVTGKHFVTLSLVQQDAEGNVLLTVTLTDVLVSSWQIGGSIQTDVPTETVSFNFVKVCIADPSTGSKFCWDKSKGASF